MFRVHEARRPPRRSASSRTRRAPFVRAGYDAYLRYVMPPLVKLSSSNDDAYSYLNESISAWPDQPTLASGSARPASAASRTATSPLGVVALHRGRKPLADAA